MKKLITICAVVVMLLCTYASASITQYATGTGGQAYYEGPGECGTFGTEFIMNQNLTLSKLGIWDEGNDGLAIAHDVALFAMDGTVLALVTISAGAANPLEDGYRWADSTPVSLVQGTHYVLGAYYNPSGSTGDHNDWIRSSATINSAFTLVKNLYLEGVPLTKPTNTYSVSGWYGPNLQAIPEPATMLLLGIGGIVSLIYRKK